MTTEELIRQARKRGTEVALELMGLVDDEPGRRVALTMCIDQMLEHLRLSLLGEANIQSYVRTQRLDWQDPEEGDADSPSA